MSEEKLRIILEWVEAHPKKYEDAVKKLDALKKQFKDMRSILVDTTQPLEKQAKVHEAMNAVYDEARTKIARTIPAARMAMDAQKKLEEQATAGGRKWTVSGKQIEAFGRKVGFTGFIVNFSIQRMIRTLTQFTQYFIDSIKAVADWPDKIMDVAYAMAMMDYAGTGTAESQKLLSDTMDTLINQGPTVESLWLGLNAVWTSIQTTLATALIPALQEVLTYLSAFLATAGAQASLRELAAAIGNLFVALAGVAPTIIQIITYFAQFLSVLQPVLPQVIWLVAIMMSLGMVCSVLGPIITVLGSIIHGVGTIQTWWRLKTLENAATMNTLKLAIIGTITTLVILGVMLYALSRTATATASDVGKSFNDLTGNATKMTWDITDANGNLLYSINTLTNEVSDATGKIIGYYDPMTGAIMKDSITMIGSINESNKSFQGMDGTVGTLDTHMGDLSTSMSDLGSDLGGLNSSIAGPGGLTESLEGMKLVMLVIAGIQFAGVISSLGTLAGTLGSLGGTLAWAGTAAGTSWAEVFLAAAFPVLAGLVPMIGGLLLSGKWTISDLIEWDPAWTKWWTEDMPKGFWASWVGQGIKAIGGLGEWIMGPFGWQKPTFIAPGQSGQGGVGQFGIPSVPRTGYYRLEKGERVKATREYGPPEEGTIANVAMPTPQTITIHNHFDSVTLASGLDVEAFADMVADRTNNKIATQISRRTMRRIV